MFSHFLLTLTSCADIDTYISDLQLDLPSIKTSKKVNEINEIGSCEVSNHRFFGVPIPFWDPFLISDDLGGRDLQISMTWRSKYWINENGSCEVSNHKFFGVPISFWDPLLISDDPGGREIQISMTSEGQNITIGVWFLLNNLKTTYIRTLKLLHFFNIIVVNKFCKKKFFWCIR